MPPNDPTHGLILLSHGSRDPAWRRSAELLLESVIAAHPGAAVGNAYLDWCEPPLPEELARLLERHPGLTTITIWPLLFGVGRHASEDIPALVAELARQHPQLRLQIAPAMGEDARVMQLLTAIAGDHLRA
ncbi:hypothetical protein GCM10027082_35840 [Comamonas humi]